METVLAPPIKEVLTVSGSPPCKVLVGDCQEIMPVITVSFDLIIADPPFNIGEPYSECPDRMPWLEYRLWTERWLNKCIPLLGERGNLWINVPDQIAARVVVHLEDVGLVMADWCIWHYRFGQWKDSGFIKSKVHALHFVRDKKAAIWNPDAVLVESDRSSKYGDKRTQNTEKPGQRVPLDVWGITDAFDGDYPGDGKFWGRVQGNNAERNPASPNQLPERYMERVIRSSSDPTSTVFTPFVGSGTELTVARALGRAGIGIEIGKSEAASAVERVARGAIRVTGEK